jgi:hypothetical protein
MSYSTVYQLLEQMAVSMVACNAFSKPIARKCQECVQIQKKLELLKSSLIPGEQSNVPSEEETAEFNALIVKYQSNMFKLYQLVQAKTNGELSNADSSSNDVISEANSSSGALQFNETDDIGTLGNA